MSLSVTQISVAIIRVNVERQIRERPYDLPDNIAGSKYSSRGKMEIQSWELPDT